MIFHRVCTVVMYNVYCSIVYVYLHSLDFNMRVCNTWNHNNAGSINQSTNTQGEGQYMQCGFVPFKIFPMFKSLQFEKLQTRVLQDRTVCAGFPVKKTGTKLFTYLKVSSNDMYAVYCNWEVPVFHILCGFTLSLRIMHKYDDLSEFYTQFWETQELLKCAHCTKQPVRCCVSWLYLLTDTESTLMALLRPSLFLTPRLHVERGGVAYRYYSFWGE